jgi:hypothetical protein
MEANKSRKNTAIGEPPRNRAAAFRGGALRAQGLAAVLA